MTGNLYSPEHVLMFEIFEARPRTDRLRKLVTVLYTIAARTHVKQPFDWLGDRCEDLCRWDLMRQYRHMYGNDYPDERQEVEAR